MPTQTAQNSVVSVLTTETPHTRRRWAGRGAARDSGRLGAAAPVGAGQGDAFINVQLHKRFSPQTRAELAQLAQEWATFSADLERQSTALRELADLCRRALEDNNHDEP